MLEFLRGKASDRKLRLFAAACCRRIWQLLPDETCRSLVESAEQYADGGISEPAFDALSAVASEVTGNYYTDTAPTGSASETAFVASIAAARSILKNPRRIPSGARPLAPSSAWQPASSAAANDKVAYDWTLPALDAARKAEQATQCGLLRDILGPLPFRPVTLDRSWLTSTVTSLAQAIYTDRAFDRLPILADALEDAGCTNQDILAHCRQSGEHVRGCWVVDLLLGKT
jgi:hypothetical protein